MTRSGIGWPENTKKYKMIAVQVHPAQYDAIPLDVPVSQYVREALEEKLLREVPEYGRREPGGEDVRGDEPADSPRAAAAGD